MRARSFMAILMALILCISSFPVATLSEGASAPNAEVTQPVETPTEAPTEAPTEVPTEVPTEAPTEVPTETPTEVPTEVPTEIPTEVPTETPTEVPTETPTEAPSQEPPTDPANSLPDLNVEPEPGNYTVYLKYAAPDGTEVFSHEISQYGLEGSNQTAIASDGWSFASGALKDAWDLMDSTEQKVYTLTEGAVVTFTVYAYVDYEVTVSFVTEDGTQRGSAVYTVRSIPGRATPIDVAADFPISYYSPQLTAMFTGAAGMTGGTLSHTVYTCPTYTIHIDFQTEDGAAVGSQLTRTIMGYPNMLVYDFTLSLADAVPSGYQLAPDFCFELGDELEVTRVAVVVALEQPQVTVSISLEKYVIFIGQDSRISVTVEGSDDKTVTWKSSNEKVAVIDQDGRVNSFAYGSIVVTATHASGAYATCTLEVYDRPTGVKIVADTTDVAIGGTLQLHAVFEPATAYQRAKWASSNKSVATVDANGLVKGLKRGRVAIRVSAITGNIETEIELSVKALLLGITLTGKASLSSGQSTSLKYSYTPDDLEIDLIWRSSNPSIATVKDGKVTAKTVLIPALVTISATPRDYPDISAQHEMTILPAVTAVAISAPGGEIDLTPAAPDAEGKYKTMQLTASCAPASALQEITWKSMDATIATVDKTGLVTAKKPGKTVITATAKDGTKKMASHTIVVRNKLRAISLGSDFDLASGKTFKLKPVLTPANATNKGVIWSISSKAAANVDQSGVVTAKTVPKAFEVTVTATSRVFPEISGSVKITIRPKATSVVITAPSTIIDIGDGSRTVILTASCLPADAMQDVVWSSGNKNIASVTTKGLPKGQARVTCKQLGAANITARASDGSYVRASVKLQFICPLRSIRLGDDITLASGQQYKLTPVFSPKDTPDKGIKWDASDNGVAKVSNFGVVTARDVTVPTKTNIYVQSAVNPNIRSKITVTVVPRVTSVKITSPSQYIDFTGDKKTLQLTAACLPDGAMQEVRWKSSDTKIASVNSMGVVIGKKLGTVRITATARDGSGKKDSFLLKVVVPLRGIELGNDQQVTVGKTLKLGLVYTPDNASDIKVKWESSDTSVATVNNFGIVTPKNVQVRSTVTITATSTTQPDVKDSVRITVNPKVSSIEITGSSKLIDLKEEVRTMQLAAACTPADAEQKVKWESNKPQIAKVSADGLVTGLAAGSAVVTATAADGSGVSAKYLFRVVNAVKGLTLTVTKTMVPATTTLRLKAVIAPADATNKGVRWESSNKDVATVSSLGVVKGKKVTSAQKVTITAISKENNDVQASVELTVVPLVTYVGVTAPQKYIDLDSDTRTMQLTAVCEPADAMQKVRWRSKNKDIATVDSNGLVTGLKEGTCTVIAAATDGSGVEYAFRFEVSTKLKAIAITGSGGVAKGKTIKLKAELTPKNTTENRVRWSSSNTKCATVDGAGRVTGVSYGEGNLTATITCTSVANPAIKATFDVTVCKPSTKLEIANREELGIGVIAVNYMPKGGVQVKPLITPKEAWQGVTFSSSNKNICTIDSNGFVTPGIKMGTSRITVKAQDGSGKQSVISLTFVLGLTSVKINDSPRVIKAGKTLTLTVATEPGTPRQNHDSLEWISSDPDVLSVVEGKLSAKAGINQPTKVTITVYSCNHSKVKDSVEFTVEP